MIEHWVTSMEEIWERLSWLYTKVIYRDNTLTVWTRDKDDRPIYLRHQGVPVNWAYFECITPRDVELAKILHLDWSLEEENAFNDLLRLLENGGFPHDVVPTAYLLGE